MPPFLKKEHFCIVLLLLCITIVSFYEIIFLNKTFKVTTIVAQALHNGVYGQQLNRLKFLPQNGTDTAILEEPILQFVKNTLWQGILPLWNPHQACGFPLIGIIEIGLFYPLNLIMYLLPQA